MDNLIKKNEYRIFLDTLKTEIISARQKAYQIVNQRLVGLYLYIGKSIYEKIEVSKWGEGVVETLAEDLRGEFPDMKGFSVQNLWRMKQLYETYKDNEKLSTVLRELPWSHNVLILHHTDSGVSGNYKDKLNLLYMNDLCFQERQIK